MTDASTRSVIMPALGMTQDTGEIVAWHKKVGDPVNPEDVLMEVETDKTTMEVEAGFSGYVAEIKAAAGTSVAVGSVIAVLTESASGLPIPEPLQESADANDSKNESISDSEAIEQAVQETLVEDPPVQNLKPKTQSRPVTGTQRRSFSNTLADRQSNGEIILASPKAKWVAHEKGVSLKRLMNRGIELPILVADVVEANATSNSSGTLVSQLQVQVATGNFIGLHQWLTEVSDGTVGAATAWCVFGAAAIRQALGYSTEDDVLVRCENWSNRDLDITSLNPDAVGFLDVRRDETAAMPDLLIRDMTGTNYRNYQPQEQQSNINLSIIEENSSHFLFTLNFDENELPLSNALIFVQYLSERTEQPLRQLL